ncbi:hypothetical protein KEM52_004262, partial [Ascosphaera acerosa]
MQRILNHKTPPRAVRDLDLLAQHRLPSQPAGETALSLLLAQMAGPPAWGARQPAAAPPESHFSTTYAAAAVGILQRCLREKHYAPVGVLLDMLAFVVGLDGPRCVPALLDSLVPTLVAVCSVNGNQRYFSSPTHQEKQRED